MRSFTAPMLLIAGTLAIAPAAAALGGDDVLWQLDHPGGSTFATSESMVYGGANPEDTEVADDFNATGLVERLLVSGWGCSQCPVPVVEGVFVRFYEWAAGVPGTLEQELFVAGDDPAFVYSPVYPYSIEITLPQPFSASGWHFVSVQLAFGDSGGTWRMIQTNRFNHINAPSQLRNNLAGGQWVEDNFFGTPNQADIVITLLGQAAPATPAIDAVSRTTVTSSDRITVTGSNFGAPGNGELLIAGAPALITQWSATQIVGYVPEGIPSGVADLTVVNLGEPSAATPITIVPRAPVGRVRWVFEGEGSYSTHPPAVGPTGTVHFDDVDGNLYAMSPDGGLLWIADELLGQQGSGDEGPIAVGADGTIYVGTNPLGPTAELVAFNPDGTHKWTFTIANALTWQAGPSLGPDGRIYGALNAAQAQGNPYDVFAVNPDGTLAWDTNASPFVLENASPGSALVFGPSSPGGAIDQLLFVADGNGSGNTWGFDLDNGSQNFNTPIAGGNDVGQTQLAGNPTSGDFYMMEFTGGGGWGLQSFDADGSRMWRLNPGIASGATHPAVGPDGTIFFGYDLGRLTAVTPQGATIWTTNQNVMYNHPVPSPNAPLLFAAGNLSFSQPAFIEARDTNDGALLWNQGITDDAGADVATDSKPLFTANGQTVYFTALEMPITPTSTYRVFAVDTTDGSEGVPGDIDGDGAVGTADLLALLAAWGPCNGCPEDLDDDGVVGTADLLTLLSNWG